VTWKNVRWDIANKNTWHLDDNSYKQASANRVTSAYLSDR